MVTATVLTINVSGSRSMGGRARFSDTVSDTEIVAEEKLGLTPSGVVQTGTLDIEPSLSYSILSTELLHERHHSGSDPDFPPDAV